MKTLLDFDYKKATQAINFFAKKRGGRISKLEVIKFIYLADRYHLRKYGRPIVNDQYWAMPYGPVGSTVKDIAEFSSFLSDEEKVYASDFLAIGGSENSVVSTNEVDRDEFSETDLEALEFAYNNFNGEDLVQLTHLYPEWSKHEDALDNKETSREQMTYADFFENPDDLDNDRFELGDDEIESSKHLFTENYRMAEVWGS